MTREELIREFAEYLCRARFGPDVEQEPLASDFRKAEEMVTLAESRDTTRSSKEQ